MGEVFLSVNLPYASSRVSARKASTTVSMRLFYLFLLEGSNEVLFEDRFSDALPLSIQTSGHLP